jgi:predicted RNA-binding protein YlqC (UPF0109 family)
MKAEGARAIEFVKYILQQICDHQDDLKVTHIEDDKGLLISIEAHDEDMGKIIGKKGQMISALRLLVKAMGSRTREKINIKVLDGELAENKTDEE